MTAKRWPHNDRAYTDPKGLAADQERDRLLHTINAIAVAAGLPDALADDAPDEAHRAWTEFEYLSQKVASVRHERDEFRAALELIRTSRDRYSHFDGPTAAMEAIEIARAVLEKYPK